MVPPIVSVCVSGPMTPAECDPVLFYDEAEGVCEQPLFEEEMCQPPITAPPLSIFNHHSLESISEAMRDSISAPSQADELLPPQMLEAFRNGDIRLKVHFTTNRQGEFENFRLILQSGCHEEVVAEYITEEGEEIGQMVRGNPPNSPVASAAITYLQRLLRGTASRYTIGQEGVFCRDTLSALYNFMSREQLMQSNFNSASLRPNCDLGSFYYFETIPEAMREAVSPPSQEDFAEHFGEFMARQIEMGIVALTSRFNEIMNTQIELGFYPDPALTEHFNGLIQAQSEICGALTAYGEVMADQIESGDFSDSVEFSRFMARQIEMGIVDLTGRFEAILERQNELGLHIDPALIGHFIGLMDAHNELCGALTAYGEIMAAEIANTNEASDLADPGAFLAFELAPLLIVNEINNAQESGNAGFLYSLEAFINASITPPVTTTAPLIQINLSNEIRRTVIRQLNMGIMMGRQIEMGVTDVWRGLGDLAHAAVDGDRARAATGLQQALSGLSHTAGALTVPFMVPFYELIN